ncbi:MAG: CDP-2,3-bis-(O-geranylgeranyl)-sn-glycerol synthase [Candidatus Aenigmarchaeota archaeon]|nr:CDP-2,3-bis-(O-geranylgeranyl)-sn-glycerol synthase [Candidatus Aenigmarchaeota archaeon]
MTFDLVAQSLWFIFPAYCANAFPLLVKGKRPLDFGKNLGKHRILGDGKTIEGAIGGIFFGILIGWLQMGLHSYLPSDLMLARLTIQLIILLSTGAILGDIIGAFIKRRLGLPRGHPALFLDQLDFLAIALLFSSFAVKINLNTVVALVVITPLLHMATNRIGYWIRVKKVPY